eukprot:CAMPEP_0116063994 /NCGR_PEP_ID=MMETSP0322-20121206/8805_1 /TAXON_ID=163516 /ORGANISM="Leptocylindrus danicus var. apora, Strain B651" /LENGTH=227 /DNA_ID=CAMNT_0003549837 /DNA_START=212 /DNA_END=892 /DNA_ORIENTATION=+
MSNSHTTHVVEAHYESSLPVVVGVAVEDHPDDEKPTPWYEDRRTLVVGIIVIVAVSIATVIAVVIAVVVTSQSSDDGSNSDDMVDDLNAPARVPYLISSNMPTRDDNFIDPTCCASGGTVQVTPGFSVLDDTAKVDETIVLNATQGFGVSGDTAVSTPELIVENPTPASAPAPGGDTAVSTPGLIVENPTPASAPALAPAPGGDTAVSTPGFGVSEDTNGGACACTG